MPCSCGFSLNYPQCDGTHKIVRKAQQLIVDQIIEEYKTCLNVEEFDGKMYCTVWYKHDDCVRLMGLLNKITKSSLYTMPEVKPQVKDTLNMMLTDPQTSEIIKRLEDNGI